MLLNSKAYSSSPLLNVVASRVLDIYEYIKKQSKTVFINHSQNLNKRDVLTLFYYERKLSAHKALYFGMAFIFFFSSVPFVLAESSIWELYLFTKVIFKFVKIATSRQLDWQQYCHIKNITFVHCLFIIVCFHSIHLQVFLFAKFFSLNFSSFRYTLFGWWLSISEVRKKYWIICGWQGENFVEIIQ